SFESGNEITFSPLTSNNGTEGPLIIEQRMLKFPTKEGIVTIRSSLLIPAECASIGTSFEKPREERTYPANFTVALHPNFLDQEVVVGGSLSDRGRTELCALLKKNLDIFAWKPFDMTGVPRSVA
nr:reverse transcriptase domain-containing protein [Tanacetum cinerariifolium]